MKNAKNNVMIKRIFNALMDLYWRFRLNPVDYARHLGVKVGNNCFIDIRHWGTEPYLITIGSNVAITTSVSIHCHGGVELLADRYQILIALAKL